RDVIHRGGRRGDFVGFRVIEIYRPRIGELRERGLVHVELRDQRLGRDGDGDHLAPFLGRADGEHLHARRRLREQPHILVDFLRIGQLGGGARDVAERGRGRRNRLRRRHVVHERRKEERLGGVFLDFLRVLLVDRLLGVAAGLQRGRVALREHRAGRNRGKYEGKG